MFPPSSRILVADDLKTIRSLLVDILRKIGYANVSEAEDGKKAKAKIEAAVADQKPYDLLITDWNMPGLSGIELLEQRNADPQWKNMAILMITVESEREYVLKAVSMGVNDFIVKPFSEKTISEKMQGIWNRLNHGKH